MRKATKFIVLRDIETNGQILHQLNVTLGKPKIVATLYDEEMFNNLEHVVIHLQGVFFGRLCS